MNEKKHETSELQKINYHANLSYNLLVGMVFLLTIGQVVLHDITFVKLIPLYITMILTVVVGIAGYHRMKDSTKYRHVIGTGCGCVYMILLATNNNKYVFFYSIPMLIILTAYGDLYFSSIINAGVILLNILYCIRIALSTPVTEGMLLDIITQMGLILCTTGMVFIVTKLTIGVNRQKEERLLAEKDKVSGVLDRTLLTSNEMIKDINEISTNMEQFAVSVAETQNAMEEVSKGTNETAESIQLQLIKTEEIQKQIENVTIATSDIEKDIELTKAAIALGQKNINNLIAQAGISQEASTTVANELSELDKSTEQMHSIIGVIHNVAKQTSLLSLNASIEAARAGEAGRGFAVVAGEISTLANQTQEATNNISTLIGNVSTVVNTVVSSINHLIEINSSQAKAAEESAESFENIRKSAEDIYHRGNDLSESVSSLASSNHEIIESISTISAITEEVSAHSNATYSSGEKNAETLNTLSSIVSSLTHNAEILQNTDNN